MILPSVAAWHAVRLDPGVSRPIQLTVIRPLHPERVCWGCDKYCASDNLACGNDTVRTSHPCELFGDDWMQWSEEQGAEDTLVRLFPDDVTLASRPEAHDGGLPAR